MACIRSSAVDVGALAFLSAVRSAERWARLRTVAARDFRMFFLADAIFGTKVSKNSVELAGVAKPGTYRRNGVKSSWDSALLSPPAPLPYARCAPLARRVPAVLARSRLHTLQIILLVAPVLLFSVIAHEIAHGYAALRQGDRTALEAGRLTWNPVKHIDPRNYRHPRRGDIIVSLAGVFTNLLVGIACAILIILTGLVAHSATVLLPTLGIIQAMLVIGILLNAGLIAFNLLPIPPLDGSHVMKYLLPRSLAIQYVRFGRYGLLVLIVLLAVWRRGLDLWLFPAQWAAGTTIDALSQRGFLIAPALQWLQ